MLPKLAFNQEEKNKFLSSVILSLVIAGRDTTASVLTWIVYELSRRPDIQNKLIGNFCFLT